MLSLTSDIIHPSRIIHLSKLCIGSGILALPFAISKGGLVLSPIFLGLIAVLNGVSCDMMVDCKNAVRCQFDVPAEIISTYSRISFCGGGWPAVYTTDFSIIITLLGVCVTYLITFTAMMEDLPIFDVSEASLAWISFVLVYPLCCSKDVSKLAKFSLAGLCCLLLAVAVIILFGIFSYGPKLFKAEGPELPLFSENIDDFATFCGIATFGFGLCSLAFPVEESMTYPQEFGKAVQVALIFVWLVYVIVGDGIAFLFVHDERGIDSNILRNLPLDDTCAHIVRFAMALVCILTLPLTFIPPAQMIEQLLMQCGDFLQKRKTSSFGRFLGYSSSGEFQSLNGNHDMEQFPNSLSIEHISTKFSDEDEIIFREPSRALQLITRGLLLWMCHAFAIRIPCFGLIVSLLGCFTVTILSFVLPPYLSLNIISKRAYESLDTTSSIAPQVVYRYYRDIWMIVFGVLLCLVLTVIVSIQCYNVYFSGKC